MANTTIKITQLQNIGNGLAINTLLPVVNTSGTAITQKVTVGNVANFALSQAGNTLAPAFLANLAYSVVNAAQPNITSVGTLNVNTLKISGGTNGYILQTDGTGNLAWTAQSGGGGNGTPGGSNAQIQYNLNGEFAGDPDLIWDAGTGRLLTSAIEPGAIYTDEYYYANGEPFSPGNGVPSGSNTQIQFNDTGAFGGNTGFTFNKTSGLFSAPFLAGNGNGLANIQGANVAGFVPNANVANTAFAVAVANVVGIGNIATVALSGSSSNVLYGNGVWAPAGGANTGNIGFTSNAIYNLGGILVENADLTHGATAALSIPINGNTTSPVQLTNTYGNVQVTTGINSGSLKYWTFDQYGTLNFPGGTVVQDDIEGTGNFGFEMPANVGFGILTDLGNNEWSFGSDGNLTLPGNTFAVNYANGTPVNIGGGSGNTGNVTFDNQIVIGTGDSFGGGGLYLAEGPDSVANLQYLRVRAGDYPTHIHLDTGNNNAYDQYFGDDGKYLKLQADGNISIGVDYSPNVWTFDSSHNLTVPGDIKSITTGFSFTSNISGITTGSATVIVTVADSTFGAPVTGQVTISGVVGTTEANNTWYFQVTEANEFQLYYDQALDNPVDGTGWTAYVSGGLAVSAGYNDLGITGGNVSITTNSGNSWTFDTNGAITLPSGTGPGQTNGYIQTANSYPTLLAYGSGGHGGPELDWMDSDDPANVFGNANVLRHTMYLNDEGLFVGFNENGVANVPTVNWNFNPDGTTIFPTLSVQRGDNPSGTITGQTLLFGDATQEAIISTPDGNNTDGINSQRLVINPGQGYDSGEGGDIYLWAGRGGSASGSGGDIKIRGGQGMADGTGGYIRIEGGDTQANGYPGYIDITGGQGGNTEGGYVHLTGGQGATAGGEANVQGGYGAVNGGNVNITGGSAGSGLLGYGNVNINAGASTWTFDNTGSFVFPGAGVTMDGQTNALLTSGIANVTIGTFVQGADGGVSWEYQGDGADANTSYGAVALDTAGTANTANLQFKVQLVADQGNASTNKEWLFDTAGNLTVPGSIIMPPNSALIGSLASPSPSISGFSSISGLELTTVSGHINSGATTVVDDGINSIALAPGAEMDVFGFPFSGGGIRGQLTISGDISTTEAIGTWYYQSTSTLAYKLYTDNTYSTLVDASAWTPYTGGGSVAITKHSAPANVVIDSNGYLTTFDNTGNITASGNIKVNSFTGNLVFGRATATGSPGLSSTSSITFAANRAGTVKEMTLGTSGDLSLDGNISTAANISGGNFIGNGDTLSNVATQTTGSWTLATGVNTVSLSVPGPGTYSIWVNGNIPNGIITYTATGVVTNNNVPVLGSQYGWYYLAGNALVLTSMPNQFTGTSGSISTATVSTTTANVFSFGITNNSGSSQVVNYGYTKL